MLPLWFGWSLWFHLLVQYPKTVGALLLALTLANVPIERIGLGAGDATLARAVVCELTGERLNEWCSRRPARTE